jgi:hypothetical protein
LSLGYFPAFSPGERDLGSCFPTQAELGWGTQNLCGLMLRAGTQNFAESAKFRMIHQLFKTASFLNIDVE